MSLVCTLGPTWARRIGASLYPLAELGYVAHSVYGGFLCFGCFRISAGSRSQWCQAMSAGHTPVMVLKLCCRAPCPNWVTLGHRKRWNHSLLPFWTLEHHHAAGYDCRDYVARIEGSTMGRHDAMERSGRRALDGSRFFVWIRYRFQICRLRGRKTPPKRKEKKEGPCWL
jgi:hypothetical protein